MGGCWGWWKHRIPARFFKIYGVMKSKAKLLTQAASLFWFDFEQSRANICFVGFKEVVNSAGKRKCATSRQQRVMTNLASVSMVLILISEINSNLYSCGESSGKLYSFWRNILKAVILWWQFASFCWLSGSQNLLEVAENSQNVF